MLSEVEYDGSNRLVRVSIVRDLQPKDLRDALDQITQSGELPAQVNVIWNLLNVNFYNVDVDILRELKAVRDQYADLRRDSRAAIVVPGGVEASLMKLFSDIAQTPSGHVKIVGSLEEAESWCMGID